MPLYFMANILSLLSGFVRASWANKAVQECVLGLFSLAVIVMAIWGLDVHIRNQEQAKAKIEISRATAKAQDVSETAARVVIAKLLSRADSISTASKAHATAAVTRYTYARDTVIITDTAAVRGVIAKADTAIDSLTTALVASDSARHVADLFIVSQDRTIVRVTAERDSAYSAALTGRLDAPPRTGLTIGPAIGIGECATKSGYGPCASVGISLSWGLRLGKR